MEEFSKITADQIDIEALADYVVHSRNLVYRSGEGEKSSSFAQDVDKVGGIDSDRIAIAASNKDRYTVKNALCLAGIPAEEYVTIAAGNDITSEQEQLKNMYGADIQDIRDELYLLKTDMINKGFIGNKGDYAGFIDTFETDVYKNIQDKICDGRAHSDDLKKISISSNNVSNFDVFDFVVVNNPTNNIFDVKEIIEIGNDYIVLDSPIRKEVGKLSVELYKSKGFIHRGMYKFAKNADKQIGSEENHCGLSDDTYKTIRTLKRNRKGFGYSFRIPYEKQGFITSFEICAKAVGAPGAMMCYIINEKEAAQFRNPLKAQKELSFFAKSKPYKLNAADGKKYIKFDMLQENGEYPILPKDVEDQPARYVAIIEALDVDDNNYFDILFLQTKKDGVFGDLQLNNTTYEYVEKDDIDETAALTTSQDTNSADLYYQVITRNIVENRPEPQKQGLYTAHISKFDLKKDFYAKKARLSLRIKREGEYKTNVQNTTAEAYVQRAVPLKKEDTPNSIRKIEDLGLKTDIYKRVEEREDPTEISEKVKTAIGSNITRIQGYDEDSIVPESPVIIRKNDKVYRIGYLVSLKARKVDFNDITGEIISTPYDHYVLPLVKVFKKYDSDEKCGYSDNIIFETNFDKKKDYNDFEIQIFWENRELSDYIDIKQDSMGAIKDVVLSFARSY